MEGCTVGPTLCSGDCVDWRFVRIDGGGGRVGYLRGVAWAAVLAVEEAVLEALEPISAMTCCLLLSVVVDIG